MAQFIGSYPVYDLQTGWQTHLATDFEDMPALWRRGAGRTASAKTGEQGGTARG